MPESLEEKFSGQLLSEARKKKRLRYKRLSSELNIPEKYLQALEEEDYEVMPGGDPYIKGYLRAYAKKLELDPDFIIEKYLQNLKSDKNTPNKQIIKLESKLLPFKKYILPIVFLLFFSFFIYFSSCSQNDQLQNAPENFYDKGSDEVKTTSRAKIKVDNDTDILEENKEKILFNKTITKPVEILATEAPIVLEDLLQFYFPEECWVEVYNESERLVFKLAKAGTSLEVNSKGPFKIKIGNANYATLRFNGIVIDLLESSNRENNVSWVVLPSGK
jgi:cytoskeletal protein RodZ|tara:strand:+ start:6847 stop:7671 length:825 start_codon:yes stop_codon:yes gene_type:complete